MGAMASQITSLTIVYSTFYSGADQRKHQRSTSLAFVREFTGDRWIPRTKASNAEYVSINFGDVIMGDVYGCDVIRIWTRLELLYIRFYV